VTLPKRELSGFEAAVVAFAASILVLMTFGLALQLRFGFEVGVPCGSLMGPSPQ
jgi:hypothetical protein